MPAKKFRLEGGGASRDAIGGGDGKNIGDVRKSLNGETKLIFKGEVDMEAIAHVAMKGLTSRRVAIPNNEFDRAIMKLAVDLVRCKDISADRRDLAVLAVVDGFCAEWSSDKQKDKKS